MSHATVNQWRIPSSNGYASITFELIVVHEAINHIEHRVEMVGQSWYRPEFLVEPPEFHRVLDDFNITLSSVVIPVSAYSMLQNEFENWLTSYAPFACTLCSRPDQELTIRIGPMKGYESTPERPTLTCTYMGGWRGSIV
jgi:hypothetical protein